MYARIDNNRIKTYNKIPSKFRSNTINCAGGFHKMDSSIHLAEGFKPLVKPEISDPLLYRYGEIIENTNTFEYTIVLIKPDQTLVDAKLEKIVTLKSMANSLFEETNWYYEREVRTVKIPSIATKIVPDWVLIRDERIYDNYDIAEAEIDALTTIPDVLHYTITLI